MPFLTLPSSHSQQPTDERPVEPVTILLSLVLGFDTLPVLFITVENVLASPQVSFVWLDAFSLVEYLPAEDEDDVQGDAEIS